jgi:hypothetical protein
MNRHQSIKDHLTPWLRVSTWDSLHPLDQARFHKALGACFRALGPQIEFGDFEQAMTELLNELHPTSQPLDRSERVRSWAMKAEGIASYLFDNSLRA